MCIRDRRNGGGSAKRGVSKKEGKSPAKKCDAAKSSGKGGSQGQSPSAMPSEQVRLASERQGVIAEPYLEFNGVKSALGSAECRRLRDINLCFNCGKAGHSYRDCTTPMYNPEKGKPSKGKGKALRKVSDGVCPRKGLPQTLPRGQVVTLSLNLIPRQGVSRRLRQTRRRQGPCHWTPCRATMTPHS